MGTIVFLGKEITMSDNFLYDIQRDYWLYYDENRNIVTFGLTPSGVWKEGGCRSVEFTVAAGDTVQTGDTLAVAVTGKIKYLECPVGGKVLEINGALEATTQMLENTPYAYWWLARLIPEKPVVEEGTITALEHYLSVLLETDRRNAHGAKGGGSPTCKSVYSAIQKQKDTTSSGEC